METDGEVETSAGRAYGDGGSAFSSCPGSFWSEFDDWVSSSDGSKRRRLSNSRKCGDDDSISGAGSAGPDVPLSFNSGRNFPSSSVVDSDHQHVDAENELLGGSVEASCSSLPNSGGGFRSADMIRLCRENTRELLEFEGPSCSCVHCGAVFWYGERLDKRRDSRVPQFYLCCGHGKVKLPYLRDSPALLEELMDYNGGEKAKNFRTNIRQCNCLYNFTSFGVNIDKSVTNQPGPFCYRIYGETYHCIGSLLPSEGDSPKFAQLYIVDTENEVKNRLAAVNNEELSNGIDEKIIEDLKNMFDLENKLVKIFRSARDAFKENPDIAFQLKLVAPFKKDGSQYADGECSEVVGLIVGEEDNLAVGFEIAVQYVGGTLKRVDMLHPSYMPLQYPILFPFGEDGYHCGMKLDSDWVAARPNDPSCKKRKRLSPAQYYRFRLQQRLFETTRLFRGADCFAI